MQIIGQDRIKDIIGMWVAVTYVPQSIIVQGPTGQGKATMASYLAEQLEADLYLAKDNKVDTVREIHADAQKIARPRVYVFKDADNLTLGAQNALLKLSEEPPKDVYLVFCAVNAENLLTTIRSRSAILNLQNYSKRELEEALPEDIAEARPIISKLATNIGEQTHYIDIPEHEFNQLYANAEKCVHQLGQASLANVLKLSGTIDDDKISAFIAMLLHHVDEGYKTDYVNYRAYGAVANVAYRYKRILRDNKNVQPKKVLDLMLIDMWRELRTCSFES